MNQTIKPASLKLLTLAAALLGILLRFLLYATAIDQKGLIIPNHWATLSLSGLSLLFLAGMILLARNPKQELSYLDCFSPSLFRGFGTLIIAVSILFQSYQTIGITDQLDRIISFLGFFAGVAMVIVAVCRFLGSKPISLCHGILSIYFALQTVSLYRNWSSDPQLVDYVFYLAAFICLMLTAYFLAQFHVDTRSHRPLWITAMAATYFCIVAVPMSGNTPFLLACGFWALTCPPQLGAKPRRQRPAMRTNEE